MQQETFIQVGRSFTSDLGPRRVRFSLIESGEPICPNGTDSWSIQTNYGPIGDFETQIDAQNWINRNFPLHSMKLDL